MPQYTQKERRVSVTSPLGQDVLLFKAMSGSERLGRLFKYELTLLSEKGDIDFADIVGQNLTVEVELLNGETRCLNGYVSRFVQMGNEGHLSQYQATVVPWLWLLTRTSDCRIFQDMTVPEIVKQVLGDAGYSDIEDALAGEHPQRTFCVQYRETTFNFVSRLMEEEGIYYYFEHEQGKHTMVLADSGSAHQAFPGYEELPYRPTQTGFASDQVTDWTVEQEVKPGAFAFTDYDFEAPKKDLMAKSAIEREHAVADQEIFDYPGGYTESADGDPRAKVRMEELQAAQELVSGITDARGLCPGWTFKLTGHSREDQNREYLVTGTTIYLRSDEYFTGGGGGGELPYSCQFTAIDAQRAFRSARSTPKPLVEGPQTALVVGPSGEKVWTDQYGRVKLHFHWDRHDEKDENSSCWVRVSQNWAGANWGGMFLPHVGQEVIVEFLEGDPDRPIITGRVYNADNMPPLELPAHNLKSIIRDHYSNEIVLDGTEGQEHISIHSPHHYSMMQIGRSTKTFTRSTQASCSYDSESYHFGSKKLYVKGTTWSMQRGFWGSVKMGAGFSILAGAEGSVTAGVKGSLTLGGSFSVAGSWSFSYGYSRDFKATKGDYKRQSSKDILIDSEKTVYVTGGSNDNTLLSADNTKLCLSFDDSKSDRDMSKLDKKAKRWAAGAGAALGAAGALAGWSYQYDVDKGAETLSKDGKTVSMDADYEQISGWMASDWKLMGGLFMGGLASIMAIKSGDVTNPDHSSPSAKITVEKDTVELFAGEAMESRLVLTKNGGIEMTADKGPIVIDSAKGILYKAKKAVKLTAQEKVVIDAMVKHANLTVLK